MQFTVFKRIAPLFLVVMMLCMTLSVTAFAAEAEIPDGWTVLDNGESVTFTASPQVKKLIPVTEGTTYTFAGDSQFGVFMGVKANGTTEVIGRANEMNNSYTADGTYQWITISCYNVSSITGTILNTVPIEYKDVGTFRPTWNSLYVLEEAGIGIDSRQYKSLTTDSKRFAAMHGHQGVDVLVVSQTVDIDKAYRQRSQIMYIASKVGPFTLMRRITYSVDVDKTTRDLVDAYDKVNPLMYVVHFSYTQQKR